MKLDWKNRKVRYALAGLLLAAAAGLAARRDHQRDQRQEVERLRALKILQSYLIVADEAGLYTFGAELHYLFNRGERDHSWETVLPDARDQALILRDDLAAFLAWFVPTAEEAAGAIAVEVEREQGGSHE